LHRCDLGSFAGVADIGFELGGALEWSDPSSERD